MKTFLTIFTILSLLSVAFCLLDLDESGELSVEPVQVKQSAGVGIRVPNTNLLLPIFDNSPLLSYIVRITSTSLAVFLALALVSMALCAPALPIGGDPTQAIGGIVGGGDPLAPITTLLQQLLDLLNGLNLPVTVPPVTGLPEVSLPSLPPVSGLPSVTLPEVTTPALPIPI